VRCRTARGCAARRGCLPAWAESTAGGTPGAVGHNARSAMKLLRLHLASLQGADRRTWPVHGFVVLHPAAGAILVDTGAGGPDRVLSDWRVVNREMADALGEHGLSPADVTLVVNTHLHFDHCGQNAVFPHAAFHVQRAELERARRESRWLRDWFDFAGARFELLDGDAEIAPGVRAVATPGHTAGHQSVVVSGDDGDDVLIGDAAYTGAIFRRPDLPPVDGQATDVPAWRASLARLRDLRAARIHFCHDTAVVTAQR
jgi:N-acyl homoserine lactone hydrolase